MKDRVLVTGGAGFIGSRLVRALLKAGYEVSILDNFSQQIHGPDGKLPVDLRDSVQLFRGDVRDQDLCQRALAHQHVLVHLAAETGTGQSMYRIHHYTDVNLGGTSNLMEVLLSGKHSLRAMIVASSRAIYGEGAAWCADHSVVYPAPRSKAELVAGRFEPKCPFCGKPTEIASTAEDAPFRPSSLYGLTKQVQEQMVLLYATTLGINGFALRYQNVYGPGQSLKNPYTGILAIFSNLAREDRPIQVFEDGKESRDFVYVDDVLDATMRCVGAPAQAPSALNVGTGTATTVSQVVETIISHFGSKSEAKITGAFREGDIRHNIACLKKVHATLGFSPQWKFEDGIKQFLDWANEQEIENRLYEHSLEEMRKIGLLHG